MSTTNYQDLYETVVLELIASYNQLEEAKKILAEHGLSLATKTDPLFDFVCSELNVYTLH